MEINDSFGVHAALRELKMYLLGTRKLQQEIDTLHYIMNNYIDITSFPAATGDLRKLQLCDSELLRIFRDICIKKGWCFWVDYGTLLGAKRHGGFIPWDDDMDIAMPREHYRRALSELPALLEKYGIEIRYDNKQPDKMFGIGYNHDKTGIWMDVFPFDEGNSSSIDAINSSRKKYQRQYRYLKDKNLENTDCLRKKHFLSLKGDSYCFHGMEFDINYKVSTKKENIFPLESIYFEGVKVFSPKDNDLYLKQLYGPSYMCFPKTGVEHHGTVSQKLSDRAAHHEVDLEKTLALLKTIVVE